jgi:hypothetical protein
MYTFVLTRPLVTGDSVTTDTDLGCGTTYEMSWSALSTGDNWDDAGNAKGSFWLTLAGLPECTASLSPTLPVVAEEEGSVRTTVTGMGIATLAITSLYM